MTDLKEAAEATETRNKQVIEQFEKVIFENKLSFKEATSLFRWSRWNVFNDGMPANETPILKDR
jgi:hypothetical protein